VQVEFLSEWGTEPAFVHSFEQVFCFDKDCILKTAPEINSGLGCVQSLNGSKLRYETFVLNGLVQLC
jgi:hypothetical protein